MTRQDNKLTALKVKALEKPGRYGDGLGLWLQVSENRGKSWVFRYMLHGRAVHMGLGATHTVSLQEAREKRVKRGSSSWTPETRSRRGRRGLLLLRRQQQSRKPSNRSQRSS